MFSAASFRRPRPLAVLLAALALTIASVTVLTVGVGGSSAQGAVCVAAPPPLDRLCRIAGIVKVTNHPALNPALNPVHLPWLSMVNASQVAVIRFAGGGVCTLSANPRALPTTATTRVGGDLMTLTRGTAFCNTPKGYYNCAGTSKGCPMRVLSNDPTYGILVPGPAVGPVQIPVRQVASIVLCEGSITIEASAALGGTVITAATQGLQSVEVTLYVGAPHEQKPLIPRMPGVSAKEYPGHGPTVVSGRGAIGAANVCGQPDAGIPGMAIKPVAP
jgi:hypothetical protein